MKKFLYNLLIVFLLTSCIENEIPYPIVEGQILSMEVEGQCEGENLQTDAVIDNRQRTVKIFVNDSVDISSLKITRLKITSGATLKADSLACLNFSKFPTEGFASLDSISQSYNTRVNFNKPVSFLITTYQKYEWTVTVEQIIKREVDVVNQVGDAVIDDYTRNVVIYVSPNQSLNSLKVNKMNLGGEYGHVEPDPTKLTDFSSPVTLYVRKSWEEVLQKWTVFVYHSKQEAGATSDVFPMVTRAELSGKMQNGKTPVIQYRKKSETNWSVASDVTTSGTSFSATLTGLTGNTDYQYQVNIDGNEGEIKSFTTVEAVPLDNGSFDNWHNEGRLWNPWASDALSFWDTGNKGATTISDSNSIPTDDTCTGSGKAASLESKYLVIKFAAGNIFTGKYVRTDGTNGVLNFGRPFSSFPTKLRVNYKYKSEIINKVGDDDRNYLKGRPDSCHIYMALTDWDAPLEIRTRPSERQLFDKNDSHIIAYTELIQGKTVSSWTQVDLPLEYRYKNRTPKYIVIVATASKFGDYFTGGVGSKLSLDNFELIYD